MQDNIIHLPVAIYSNYLKTIDNVRFSPREIDVIACLLKGRATKKIAHILSISPKTVATHVRNIMLKLETNSREGIINFIEKSGKNNIFQIYYNNLIIFINFEHLLKMISKLINFESPSCSLVFWKGQESKNFFIHLLEVHLNNVGIKVYLDEREGIEGVESAKKHEIFPVAYYLYVVFPNARKVQLLPHKSNPSQPSHIFLFLDEEFIKEGLPRSTYIALHEQGNYYFLFLELLKKLLPALDLNDLIIKFKKDYEEKENGTVKGENIPESERLSTLQPLIVKQKKKVRFFLAGILTFIAFLITFIAFRSLPSNGIISQYNSFIRSDFILPSEKTLLNRSELLAQLENIFKKKNVIQIVALVGIGGAGKTTLARQYAHHQKVNAIWEINAESPESLKNSFDHLAHALAKTEEDKKRLAGLQEIKELEEKEEKIIQFVKEHLRVQSNWFLIYDNVKQFADIQKYFPHDVETWGEGKILLTTQDSNIQNNQYINNVIPIGELTHYQKQSLFLKIMSNGRPQEFTSTQKEEAKNFLNEIPPFPLDVSIAAYYLKATGISYKKYLESLGQYNKDFAGVQENLLKEAGNYTKTRNSIVTLSLQDVINAHKDFKNILLLVGLSVAAIFFQNQL